MRIGKWPLLAASITAAVLPALAYGKAPADGEFKAVDTNEWLANGGPGHELTIQPGQTVTFTYPAGGTSFHTLTWDDARPTCQGVGENLPPGTTGTCTFANAGTYAFRCTIHPGMTGRVVVVHEAPRFPALRKALLDVGMPGLLGRTASYLQALADRGALKIESSTEDAWLAASRFIALVQGQIVFSAACGGIISTRARTTHVSDAVEAFLKMYGKSG